MMGWDVLMICDDISVFLFLLRLVRCVNVILLYVVVCVVVCLVSYHYCAAIICRVCIICVLYISDMCFVTKCC